MENAKPVLVIGATGLLGTEICRQLTAAGKKVKGLVRASSDPARVNALTSMGVETVSGDIRFPDSLTTAFEGVGSVISTASSTLSHQEGDNIESVDRQGQLHVVDAARQAGVEKFVFISFHELEESFPLQDAKREVERALLESNLDFTVLRPGYFMEVWLGPHLGFEASEGKATIYGHGAKKISWIAVRDVARYAVAALEQENENRIMDIGGPQLLSQLEVVSIFERKLGRTFELQYIPEEDLRLQYEASTDPLMKSFSALMLNLASGQEVELKETGEHLSQPLTSVEDFSNEVLGVAVQA